MSDDYSVCLSVVLCAIGVALLWHALLPRKS
jgi:hypothetical protein